MDDNGFIVIYRKLLVSKIWIEKPATWLKVWLYILGNVSHQTIGRLKRGEGYFNFRKNLDQLGPDVPYQTIKRVLTFLRKEQMIRTTKSTRGMYIFVLNYEKYQTKTKSRVPVGEPSAYHRRTTGVPLYNNNEQLTINNKGYEKFQKEKAKHP